MAIVEIPGLSWKIRQSLDRLMYQSEVYNQEFIERLKLVFGHPDYVTDPTFGIVTDTDPAEALPNSTDPLAVTPNGVVDLSVDINPGMAVTKTGVWIQLNDHIRQVDLADFTVNIPNVIALQYVVASASPEVNRYGQAVPPYTVRPGGLLPADTFTVVPNPSIQAFVVTVDAYEQLSPETRDNYIPIAIATVQSVQDPITLLITTEVDIDHTRESYEFIRPWFSAQDVGHRLSVGSGVVSPSNIHGLSANDISNGVFSPQQLQLDHGMIVGDDVSVPKQPGYRCQSSIPYSSIKTDDGSDGSAPGTYTGFPNKKYIELPGYPTRVGRVWDEDTLVEQAVLHVEETNRIVFASDDPPVDKTIGIYFTKVDACEPPVGNNESTFTTKNPTENELIVAGGLTLNNLASTSEGFADAQKFPMIYDILVDAYGSLFKAPQVVYCYKSVQAMGTTDDFSIGMYGPAKLTMGLADASGDPTMSLKVRVYGKDVSGTDIDHLFEFDSTWVNPGPIPNEQITAKAFGVSDVAFSSIDELTIEEAIDLGPDAAIMVWALINPYDTFDKLKDACHVAQLIWDGLRLTNIRDKRIVDTKALDITTNTMGQGALMQMVQAFGGGNNTVYAENFRSPKYHSQILNKDITASSNIITANLPAANMSKLRTGHLYEYASRGLPVNAASGNIWRVVLYPLDGTRLPFFYGNQQPILFFYSGGGWGAGLMNPVAGMPNTYEFDTTVTPTRVKIEVLCNEYTSMVLFG